MLILFVRVTILYLIVFAVIRLTGKRQISDLQPFDLVITLLIADLASEPAADTGIPLMYGVVPILALFLIHQIVAYLAMKSSWVQKLVCGKPVILISNGKVQEGVLRNIHYTLNDLIEQLRQKNIFELSQVSYAILETNGNLSVFLKGKHQQPTFQDFNLPAPSSNPPNVLVVDGRVEDTTLTQSGYSDEWLFLQLKKLGYNTVDDVLLASLNDQGVLYTQEKIEAGGAVHILNTSRKESK